MMRRDGSEPDGDAVDGYNEGEKLAVKCGCERLLRRRKCDIGYSTRSSVPAQRRGVTGVCL